jgi:hypothetical protein
MLKEEPKKHQDVSDKKNMEATPVDPKPKGCGCRGGANVTREKKLQELHEKMKKTKYL